MLQITCVPLINSLPADIICDSFDLAVVQWNREIHTLRRACGAQKAILLVADLGLPATLGKGPPLQLPAAGAECDLRYPSHTSEEATTSFMGTGHRICW